MSHVSVNFGILIDFRLYHQVATNTEIRVTINRFVGRGAAALLGSDINRPHSRMPDGVLSYWNCTCLLSPQ